jgi:two-component system, chemotaxis family, chemotaxis protein CheY
MPAVRSVVVVDDDRTFRAVARALLEDGGFEVVAEAETGAAALEAAASARPDAALVDVHLPDGDGFMVAAWLVVAMPHVRVVLCAAGDPEEYRTRVADCGAAGFLTKSRLTAQRFRLLIEG